MNPEQLRSLLLRVAAGDPSCADELDTLADKIHVLASNLRAKGRRENEVGRGGLGDSVKMKLVAPDGTIKQVVDS